MILNYLFFWQRKRGGEKVDQQPRGIRQARRIKLTLPTACLLYKARRIKPSLPTACLKADPARPFQSSPQVRKAAVQVMHPAAQCIKLRQVALATILAVQVHRHEDSQSADLVAQARDPNYYIPAGQSCTRDAGFFR
jgi:hypothetical protein